MDLIIGILRNEKKDSHRHWEIACKKLNINYSVINFVGNNWFDEVNSKSFDIFLCSPPGVEARYKQLFDERLYILEKVMNKTLYPTFDEVSIYENKRFLSFWLLSQNIPHPITNVFYSKHEVMDFITKTSYPIVGKFNIGASGKGVQMINNLNQAKSYVDQAFSAVGLRQNFGPNLKMGEYKSRIINIIKNPKRIKERLSNYKTVFNETQKGFVIFQEYIEHNFEWRIVKIGESYFGHKKIKIGEKASGTKGIEYHCPPNKLLDFVREICTKYDFNTMAIDLFESGENGYLINEMQTIFGHIQDHICEKDKIPGRFLYLNNKWVFEEGMFNTNLSYDLRLEHAISLLKKKI